MGRPKEKIPRPTNCTYCGKNFSNASNAQKHMERKHLGRTFDCQLCDKQFTSNELLENHKYKAIRSECRPMWSVIRDIQAEQDLQKTRGNMDYIYGPPGYYSNFILLSPIPKMFQTSFLHMNKNLYCFVQKIPRLLL